MAKDWHKLLNERSSMTDPSAWILKFNMPAGPVGWPLGPLHITRDRPDHDDCDLWPQCAKSLAEIRLASEAGFSPGFRLQTIYWALTQVHEIAAETAK